MDSSLSQEGADGMFGVIAGIASGYITQAVMMKYGFPFRPAGLAWTGAFIFTGGLSWYLFATKQRGWT